MSQDIEQTPKASFDIWDHTAIWVGLPGMAWLVKHLLTLLNTPHVHIADEWGTSIVLLVVGAFIADVLYPTYAVRRLRKHRDLADEKRAKLGG